MKDTFESTTGGIWDVYTTDFATTISQGQFGGQIGFYPEP